LASDDFSFLRLGRYDRSLIIDFYERFVQDGADHLVGAGDNLIALGETVDHLDIGGAGNPRFDLLEYRFPARNDKNALNFFLLGLLRDRIRLGNRGLNSLASGRFRLQLPLLTDGERLDRYT